MVLGFLALALVEDVSPLLSLFMLGDAKPSVTVRPSEPLQTSEDSMHWADSTRRPIFYVLGLSHTPDTFTDKYITPLLSASDLAAWVNGETLMDGSRENANLFESLVKAEFLPRKQQRNRVSNELCNMLPLVRVYEAYWMSIDTVILEQMMDRTFSNECHCLNFCICLDTMLSCTVLLSKLLRDFCYKKIYHLFVSLQTGTCSPTRLVLVHTLPWLDLSLLSWPRYVQIRSRKGKPDERQHE